MGILEECLGEVSQSYKAGRLPGGKHPMIETQPKKPEKWIDKHTTGYE